MVRKILYRAFSLSVWIGILFAFLFLPVLTNYFKDDSLNVFLWSGVFDPEIFDQFEQETGIKVNVTYFGGNEELIVKLLATKSKGYDLIEPSDYVVQFLIKHNLLKKLDKSKLTFYEELNPKLMGFNFDPENDYSVPAEWYILGFGLNKEAFKNGLPAASWDTIFDPEKMPDHLGLINDSREIIALAIFNRYGKLRPINNQEGEEIKNVLIEQKKKVEAYTDFRGDFLLESGNCPLVLVSSAFIWKTLRADPKFAFLIPKEGVFLNLENFVIPAATKKAEQTYKLLNFLFRPDIQKHNFENFSLSPTRKDADYMFNTPELQEVMPYIDPKTPQRAAPFVNVLTDEQVNEIWLAVKGS